MFVQVVGEGQEYRGRIFPRSICFVMATVFVVLHLWSTSSLCVMQFWKEIHSEFTVKALKGQNSAFLQVKFIEFLSVNVNASRVCDIRYKINDFIAFLLLHFSKFDIEWLCPDAFIYFLKLLNKSTKKIENNSHYDKSTHFHKDMPNGKCQKKLDFCCSWEKQM